MPEWVLWVLFVVVLLPVAALCLALIYALALASRVKTQLPTAGNNPEVATCDTACRVAPGKGKKETGIENS